MSYKFIVTVPDGLTYEVVADSMRHGFDDHAFGPHGDVYVFMLGNEAVAAFPTTANVVRAELDDDSMADDIATAQRANRGNRELARR